MKRVTLYHNPRCGTSRKVLDLIRGKGFEPKIIEYLKTPPTLKKLDQILLQLNIEPRALIRTKEKEYKQLKLDRDSISHFALIRAMVSHPILIERPVVIVGNKAVIGRPPERVEKIL